MIPFLTESDAQKLISEEKALELARKTFLLMADAKALMPPKMYLSLPGGNDFRAMPAFIEDGKNSLCGIKWVGVFPANWKQNLPTVIATILINSPETGETLALLEGNVVTAMRTAAAAALATNLMANPNPAILAIVGAGIQASYQLKAVARLYPFKEIRVWGFKPGEAQKFCDKFKDTYPNIKNAETVESCVKNADIVITCTPSRGPLVKADWIKKGAHINAIGADAEGKQELEPALLLKSKVVVDEWQQASHSGEINVPFSKNEFQKKHLYAELSEIVSNKKKGRTSTEDITIFDSTGLAVLDIYFARYLYNAYQQGLSKA